MWRLLAVVAAMVVGGCGVAGEGEQGAVSCIASDSLEASVRQAGMEPGSMMALYEQAAAETDHPRQRPLGDQGVWVLAAINSIESGFGRNMGPSSAGAIGWMQFLPTTWRSAGVDTNGDGRGDRRYGFDYNGDGRADPYDPEDAIRAAGAYLRRAGAPDYWYEAIFAYNHADWYVRKVLKRAEAFRGACTITGQAVLDGAAGSIRSVTASEDWLAKMPGTNIRCDRRIVENVAYLLKRFKLRLGSCYAPTGHSSKGEHPLGLAIDVTPADGNWDNTMAAARFVGWRESCARSGCPNRMARWIGYNGVVNHGDPKHCARPCPAHLHISWNHSETPYNTQAHRVDVWGLPSEGSVVDHRA